jgi:ABC-type uncharacterized transport system auxiliary subunit
MIAKILVMMLPFLIAACGGLQSKQPPSELYVLHPLPSEGKGAVAAKAEKVMIVPEPLLPAGFKTDQIVLFMQDGRRLDYFANARWPADLDRVLQDFIIQSLRKSWPHTIVTTPDAALPAAWRLLVKVVDFQPVYANGPDSTPEIHIAMTFTLVAMPDGKIINDFTLARKTMAPANTMTAVTSQMESLLRSLLREAAGKILFSKR